MPAKTKKIPGRKFLWMCACFSAALLLLALFLSTRAVITPQSFQYTDAEVVTPTETSFIPNAQQANARMVFDFQLSPFSPRHFFLQPDDCLLWIRVNDQMVEDYSLPYCGYPNGVFVDLQKHLTSGGNAVEFGLRNHQGGLGIRITSNPLDPANVTFVLVFCMLVMAGIRPTVFLRKKTGFLIAVTSLSAIVLCAFLVSFEGRVFQFAVEKASVRTENGDPQEFSSSFFLERAPIGSYDFTYAVRSPLVHSALYFFQPDDCIEEITLNGSRIEDDRFPFCGYPEGISVHLWPSWKAGLNELTVKMRNDFGDAWLQIRPVPFDPFILLFRGMAVAGLLYCAYALRRLMGKVSFAQAVEQILCAVFLLCHAWLFFAYMHDIRGWDLGEHLLMLHTITWSDPIPASVFATFYSYHPPAAFLLERSVWLLTGFSELLSAKICSILASFLAFFFLRGALKRLGVLFLPTGFITLYVASSLPVIIYLSHSVNLDVFVYCFGAAVLYLSVLAFVSDKKSSLHILHLSFITLVLVLAALVKFNGFVLCILPWLVFIFLSEHFTLRQYLRGSIPPLLCALVAVILVFPYYHFRYFQAEGTYFPNNGVVYDAEKVQVGEALRDADKLGYLVDMFTMPPDYDVRLTEHRDLSMNRMNDLWEDFWIRDVMIGKQGGFSKSLSVFYLQVGSIAVLIGLSLFLAHLLLGKKNKLLRIGCVFLVFSLIQLAAILANTYKNPCTDCYALKAGYIAPAAWGIAFLIASFFFTATRPVVDSDNFRQKFSVLLSAVLAGAFVALNHIVGVY
jgi:hypothetical protein